MPLCIHIFLSARVSPTLFLQTSLSPPNPAKQTFTTHFPNREFHIQLCTSQALRALPSHCAGIPPSLQQPTAKDKRASKRKLTYCYGLEPFLVQLCFRHPGEKDTAGERGRPMGEREKQKGEQNQNGAHTAVTGGKTAGVIAKKAELLCSSQPLLEALQAGSRYDHFSHWTSACLAACLPAALLTAFQCCFCVLVLSHKPCRHSPSS